MGPSESPSISILASLNSLHTPNKPCYSFSLNTAGTLAYFFTFSGLDYPPHDPLASVRALSIPGCILSLPPLKGFLPLKAPIADLYLAMSGMFCPSVSAFLSLVCPKVSAQNHVSNCWINVSPLWCMLPSEHLSQPDHSINVCHPLPDWKLLQGSRGCCFFSVVSSVPYSISVC